jgi:putative ABC transport system permease protein
MRAVLRWAQADLRTHRGQAVAIVLATAGVTVALLMSVALLVYAAHPWQRLFTQTHGAHVWMRLDADADTGPLRRLDTVTAVAGPFRTATVTAQHGADKAPIDLRATGAQMPSVGRPEMIAGDWPGATGAGIVLEQSTAAALWAEPGDVLTFGQGSSVLRLAVAGVAKTAEVHYSPGGAPGIGWASPSVVADLAAHGRRGGRTVGLVTSDPGDDHYLVQQAVAAVGPDNVVSVSTWQEARADAEGDNHLLGLLTGLFGLGALLAAAVAATGGIGVRVRAQTRDVSVLKAVGLTPVQVAGMFLLQHVLLAGVGALLGAVLTEALGAHVPGSLGEAMTVWRSLPSQPWSVPLIALATVLVIGAGTALAGWRAARVPPIPAARPAVAGRRRLSGVARVALRLRTPPALVLGWRAVLNRPGRSAAAAVRLMVPVLMISTALGTWATLDTLDHHPARFGMAGQLTARPADGDAATARQMVADAPGVAAARPAVQLAALAPGQTETVTLRGVGTAHQPYPYAITAGRAPSAPDEAVAGQGLYAALNVSVGQWVRLTVGSTPYILHLVGRCIETQDAGRVVSTGFDTLQDQNPALRPAYYDLQLAPGVDPAAERTALAASAHGTVEVHQATDPVVAEFSPIRRVIVGLVLLLALVVLAELSTSIATVVRDHARDLRAYRAVGLTPQQTVATMVTSSALLALAAAASGTLLGVLASHWLVDLQGASSGVGAGIAQTPPLLMLIALVTATVLVAAGACLLPALRAARDAAGVGTGEVL